MATSVFDNVSNTSDINPVENLKGIVKFKMRHTKPNNVGKVTDNNNKAFLTL